MSIKNRFFFRFVAAMFAAVLVSSTSHAQPYAYITDQFSAIHVVDIATNTMLPDIAVDGSPQALAITKNGGTIYVADSCYPNPSELIKIDKSRATVETLPIAGGCPTGVVLSPDDRFLYVVNNSSGPCSVVVLDTATDAVLGSPIEFGNQRCAAGGAAVSPDGSRFYVISSTGLTLSVIDTASATVIKTLLVGSSYFDPLAVAVTHDGKRVFVSDNTSGKVVTMDAESDTLVDTPIAIVDPNGMVVSKDDSTLYVTGQQWANGNQLLPLLFVIDIPSWSVRSTIALAANTAKGVDLTADGKYAYVVDCSGPGIEVVDLASQSVVTTIPGLPQSAGCSRYGGFIGLGDLIFRNGFE